MRNEKCASGHQCSAIWHASFHACLLLIITFLTPGLSDTHPATEGWRVARALRLRTDPGTDKQSALRIGGRIGCGRPGNPRCGTTGGETGLIITPLSIRCHFGGGKEDFGQVFVCFLQFFFFSFPRTTAMVKTSLDQ